MVRRKSKENETIPDEAVNTTSKQNGEISVNTKEKENLSNNNSMKPRSDLIQNQKSEEQERVETLQAKTKSNSNANSETNQCKENQRTTSSHVSGRWDRWNSDKSEKVEASSREKPSTKEESPKIEKAKDDKEKPKVGKILMLPCSNCKNKTIVYYCSCKKAVYCGQVCQRKHWTAVHQESEYH